jgi:hypothetical protein
VASPFEARRRIAAIIVWPLARAGLALNADRLAASHLDVDALDGLHLAVQRFRN